MRRELRLRLFNKHYEEPLDFTHNVLEKGDMYVYFLEKRHPEMLADLTKDNYPIHLSAVNCEVVDEYREFLKECLIEWGYTDKKSIDTGAFVDYTLDNFFEGEVDCNDEHKKQLEELERVDITITAFEDLMAACMLINKNWLRLKLDEIGIDGYPFEQSFDELLYGGIDDWVASAIKCLLEKGGEL